MNDISTPARATGTTRQSVPVPRTTVFDGLAVSARRFPERSAIHYYGSDTSYSTLLEQAEALAGYLQQDCGVKRGDRVLLFLQNSPQFIIGYYAILRADAVVVPVNPMNLTEELEHYVEDAGASVVLCGAELIDRVAPLLAPGKLSRAIVAAYGDYFKRAATKLPVPDVVSAKALALNYPGMVAWRDALHAGRTPGPHLAEPDDLAVMPYTSGTTGRPKGCMHTHHTLMAVIGVAGALHGVFSADTLLAVAPFFHITGMQMTMNTAIYQGATLVVMTRWDREAALELIERLGISVWIAIPTMVIDLLGSPNVSREKLASLRHMSGGGIAMPEAVAKKLHALTGLEFIEAYGMTETAAPTHTNPLDKPKRQCLGVPIFNTHALVIDQSSGAVLGPDEVGEIVSSGPQVFKGYWNNPEATRSSFIDIDGRRYFRTGDLAKVDGEGYFFMVDRLKRMINASGYKVWPAEVEAMLYNHPQIQEACVIASKDDKRGETVKALVVLKRGSDDARAAVDDILSWAKEHMATYKAPRIVEILDVLPKSGTGKILWRELQERENKTQT